MLKILKRISGGKVLYTVLFAVVLATMLVFHIINGKTFVGGGDTYAQYYPVFLYMGRYLRGILAGNFHLYDFTIGFGEDIIGALNYYGFGDPLNLLAVFAAQDNGYIFFSIVIFIKLYLSGAGMMRFLKYHDCDDMLSAGGAAAYAFSMYSLIQGMHFYVFLSAVWILPYALTNLEKLIKNDNKEHADVKFVLLTALIPCTGGFYFLYIQSIFLALYAVWVYFNEYKKIFSSKFLKKMLQILGCYLIGLMISGIFLFPALHAFFESSRTLGGDFGWQLVWGRNYGHLRRLISNLMVPVGSMDEFNLALPAVCMAAVIGSMLQKEIRKELGIPTIVLGLMYISPAFWRVMNGFSYPANRWVYVIYFWAAYITVRFMQFCINGRVKKTIYVYTLLLTVALAACHYHFYQDGIICAASVIYGVVFVVCGLRNSLNRKKALFIIAGGVWTNIFILYAGWEICGDELYKWFRDKDMIVNISDTDFESENDRSWNRLNIYPRTANDGLIRGYMETNVYLSLINGNISQFYKDFLISSGIWGMSYSLHGTDDRIAVEAVLASSKVLPFGVMYTDAVSYLDFLKLSAVERQRVPLSRIILGGGICDNSYDSGIDVSENVKQIQFETEYVNASMADGELTTQNDGEILLKINKGQITGSGELYVYLNDFELKNGEVADIVVGDNKYINVTSPKWQNFWGVNDYLVNVSSDNDIVSIKFNEAVFSLDKIELFWCGNENTQEQINKLKSNALQNLKFSSDRIEGDIDAEDEGWMFFSIPYNTGWKVYDNGKREELVKANVGFMAVKLTEGRHNIVLKYDAPWNKLGLCSTVLGMILLLGMNYRGKQVHTVV